MKRIISIILAAAIIAAAGMPAMAKPLVTVSAWAYNDVSNFTSEGLLPGSFEDVADYTRDITRLQFAELVYSAASRSNFLEGRFDSLFEDTKSEAVAWLYAFKIMEGEEIDYNETEFDNGVVAYDSFEYLFYPDRLLTREEMAVVIYRAVNRFCPEIPAADDDAKLIGKLRDFDKISQWALDSVLKLMSIGFIDGMDDGSFEPKSRLTIEQAITVVYKLYNSLPAAPKPDGADIHSSYETEVQTYPNGIVETKKNDVLYLRSGGESLMEFETDIYSNIYCESVNGITYAAAQNIRDKTEVYNAGVNELLFTIPYPVTGIDKEYIHTKSRNTGPMTFGLYDYSGRELLAPKYSLEEIEIIKKNNLIVPVDEYQAPSGWIYFADQNDGGRLCKMDSNGENKQKLTENNCGNMEYINDWLYYYVWNSDSGENQLYCIKADGTREYKISDMFAELLISNDKIIEPYDRSDSGFDEYYISDNSLFYDDEWVYYTEYDYGFNIRSLCRAHVTDEGIETEKLSGDLYVSQVQIKDGRIYFIDHSFDVSQMKANNIHSLYCYDGNALTKVSGDQNVTTYGFYDNRLVMITGGIAGPEIEDNFDTVAYIFDSDGSNPEVMTEIEEAKQRYKEKPEENTISRRIYEQYSDESFEIYHIAEWNPEINNSQSYLCAIGIDGKELMIDSDAYPIKRSGDVLYYRKYYGNEKERYIFSYDLNTGERKTVIEAAYPLNNKGTADGEDWFTYMDYSHNIWRYDAKTDTVTEVFPNSSMRKYGKVQKMLGLNDGMYKVDTDGNYSLISTEYAANCLYVENGASEGEHF